MRLVDLDPRWLLRDGHRVGFIFKSPTNPAWYQSCMFAPTLWQDQHQLFNTALADVVEKPEYGWTKVQGCAEECGWTVTGVADIATFETLSVMPSLNGAPGGLWHGYVTNGEIVTA